MDNEDNFWDEIELEIDEDWDKEESSEDNFWDEIELEVDEED